ncbi:triosephosphate isomerase [Candidatus Daviesbacteria bacterium]|nr:triosephosphate isomerase [Candidatus Daviesbacteria bacterium]
MAGSDKNIWVIANWKANKNIQEALDWVAKVGPQIPKQNNLKVVVCPTFSVLSEVKKAIQVGNFPMLTGAQDLSPFGVGAYTGEEPAAILKQFVDLAILGHSERRQNFGETDEMVSQKVAQALANNITPLVCVQGKDTPVPDGVKLIAYEPIFAIGTSNPDTPQNASMVAKNFPGKEVLYGGSVTSTNVKAFVQQENVHGVLVGGASLEADEFLRIVKACEEI